MRVEWENLESCVRLRSMREWISFRSSVWLGFAAASPSRRELSLKCDESSLSFFPDHCCLLRQFCYWFSTYHQHPHRAAAKKKMKFCPAQQQIMRKWWTSAVPLVSLSLIFFSYTCRLSSIVDISPANIDNERRIGWIEKRTINLGRAFTGLLELERIYMKVSSSWTISHSWLLCIVDPDCFPISEAFIHDCWAALELSRVTNWIPLIQLCG